MKLLTLFLCLSTASAQSITGFSLVNPKSGDALKLFDGDTIDLATEPPPFVRVETDGEFSYVEFDVDDGAMMLFDGEKPFYLGEESDGVPLPVAVLAETGLHTVKVSATLLHPTKGHFVDERTVTFTVIDSANSDPTLRGPALLSEDIVVAVLNGALKKILVDLPENMARTGTDYLGVSHEKNAEDEDKVKGDATATVEGSNAEHGDDAADFFN